MMFQKAITNEEYNKIYDYINQHPQLKNHYIFVTYNDCILFLIDCSNKTYDKLWDYVNNKKEV